MSKQGNALLLYLWCEAAMHAVKAASGVETLLSADASAERTRESESRSSQEAGTPVLDHGA